MEDIDRIGAGDALNRIVAERVMGWTYWDSDEGDWNGPDDATFFTDWNKDSLAVYVASEEPTFYFAPSTDINSAWMVMDKLGLSLIHSVDGFYAILPADIEHGHIKGTERHLLCLQSNNGEIWWPAETAMLAICRTALKLRPPAQ